VYVEARNSNTVNFQEAQNIERFSAHMILG